MPDAILPLRQLHEITLWQQLNGQLHKLKRKGHPIKDAHHAALKNFCFGNLLFSKISDSVNGNDVPLALITDLKKIFFITANLRPWTNCLLELKNNLHILDVERARANSFKEIKKWHRKYAVVKNDAPSADGDSELHSFINSYMDARESIGFDPPDIVMRLHVMKAAAVKKIIQRINIKQCLSDNGYTMVIDLEKLKSKHDEIYAKVADIYRKSFLDKIEPVLEPLGPVTWAARIAEIQILLEGKQSEAGLKDSIRNFAAHELAQYEKEKELMDQFEQTVQTYKKQELRQISICDTAPFAFLDNPYPSI